MLWQKFSKKLLFLKLNRLQKDNFCIILYELYDALA